MSAHELIRPGGTDAILDAPDTLRDSDYSPARLCIIADKPDLKTLFSSLRSHRKGKLFGMFDETMVFHRGMRNGDEALIREFPCLPVEIPENISGTDRVEFFADEHGSRANAGYVFLLDYRVHTTADSSAVIYKCLQSAIDGIKEGKVQLSLINEDLLQYIKSQPNADIPPPPKVKLKPHKCKEETGYWSVPSYINPWSGIGVLAPRKWLRDDFFSTIRSCGCEWRVGILDTEKLFQYRPEDYGRTISDHWYSLWE